MVNDKVIIELNTKLYKLNIKDNININNEIKKNPSGIESM